MRKQQLSAKECWWVSSKILWVSHIKVFNFIIRKQLYGYVKESNNNNNIKRYFNVGFEQFDQLVVKKQHQAQKL